MVCFLQTDLIFVNNPARWVYVETRGSNALKVLKAFLTSLRLDFVKWVGRSADGKGRTLWQILTGANKLSVSYELTVYNPLDIRVYDIIEVNKIGVSGRFVCNQIISQTVHIGESKFEQVIYMLRIPDREVSKLRLRVSRTATGMKGDEFQVLYERLDNEFAWDEDFHANVLCDPTGEILDHQDGTKFFRIDDVRGEYHAHQLVLEDINRDSHVDTTEVKHRDIRFWDYHRECETGRQTLTIELDKETAYFKFWLGAIISRSDIGVYTVPILGVDKR